MTGGNEGMLQSFIDWFSEYKWKVAVPAFASLGVSVGLYVQYERHLNTLQERVIQNERAVQLAEERKAFAAANERKIKIQADIQAVRDAPITDWIEYYPYVIDDEVLIGDKFFWVKSYASFRAGAVDIEYLDVLQCLDATGSFFGNFSDGQKFVIKGHYPPGDQKPALDTGFGDGIDVYLSPWKFGEKLPQTELTCRVRGTHTITVMVHGVSVVKASKAIFSNQFKFVFRKAD